MAPAELRDVYQASRRKLLDAWEENIARSNTFLTQSGRRRVPGVARCAAVSLPLTSEGGAVRATERTCGSVWGVLSGRSSFRDQYMKAKEEK
jgi:hypothetical protein